ncbi:MAG: ArnT family glycosyltransferase [Chloroflexota bacterium]
MVSVYRRYWVRILPLIDTLWVLLLAFYVLAGVHQVPFHGDESTTIWMSKDFAYLVTGDIDRLRYTDPPVDPAEQHLRLITGSLTKYLIGLSWAMNGYEVSEINEQWHWGFDWDWNQANGHAPGDELLMLGRWPSALMLAISVGVLFRVASLVGGRPVAYIASFLYALNPAVLLNGRRAMFEGGLLLFVLLVVLSGLVWARYGRWRLVFAFGIACGLAISAKHTAASSVAVLFITGVGFRLWMYRTAWRQTLSQALVIVLLAVGIFLLLNPIWWGNPIGRVSQVLDARIGILNDQVDLFGGYGGFADQLHGFWRQTFVVNPQYYEVSDWAGFIGNQIGVYEASIWRGPDLSTPFVVVLLHAVLVVLGGAALVIWRARPLSVRLGFGLWSVTMFLTAALLTPLEWQRYYLLNYPATAVLSAIGIVFLLQTFLRFRASSKRVGHTEVMPQS